MNPQSRQVLFQSKIFQVVRHERRTPAGDVVVRDIVHHPGAVAVVPILDDGRLCLIRNYRVAVGDTLWEIPAGTLDPGESPEACARRELQEETGYRCENLRKIHEFFMSPGILNEKMHLFVATGLTAGPTQLEAYEEIEVQLVSRVRAQEMIRQGEIRDAKTLVGLLLVEACFESGV